MNTPNADEDLRLELNARDENLILRILNLRLANDRLETQVKELREALQRGMELCERGHGHEWADEARAILEKTK